MTYEEISIKYPIGKLLAREKIIEKHSGFWYGIADQKFYIDNYTNVTFYNNGRVEYEEVKIKNYFVCGWVCTSDGFFVAEDTWDGWVILDDSELKEIENKGIVQDW